MIPALHGNSDLTPGVDDLTCPAPLCPGEACGAAARFVIAAREDVPAGCANCSRLADEPDRLRAALAGGAPLLTAEARRLLALRPGGGRLQSILRQLREGRLVFLEPRTPRPLRLAPSGRRKPLTPPATPETRRAVDQDAWIKLRVVDDASGAPLPGVLLKVTQPNGKTFDYTTRADGAVEVHDIDPGACGVACGLENAQVADTYAFSTLGEQPSSAELTETTDTGDGVAQAAMLGVRIAHVEEHKVRTGESIRCLAESNGLTWQALARFNWGTDVPDEINRKLRDEVGCTKKTPDGFNYVFDDSDEPGILPIPKPWSVQGLATEQTHTIRVRAIDRHTARIAYIRLGVYDEDEQPLPDTACTITDRKGQTVYDGVTDAQGRIRKDDVEFDDFRLEIEGLERIIPSVAYDDEWVDVFLRPAGYIRLLVHDPAEQPLAGAAFTIADDGGKQLFAGASDAAGQIKRDAVKLGDYRLAIGTFERIIPAVAYDDEWIDVFTGPPATGDKPASSAPAETGITNDASGGG